MVLGHFGRKVSLEELRTACGVSRDGSNAANLVKAGRSYGLVTSAFRKELDDLPALGFPVIVFWGFNHFLVVEGITKRGVQVNDPASGRRVVSREEFDASFTGIVLTFAPGDDFHSGGHERSLFASLRGRLHGSGPAIAFCVVAGLGLVVPGLVVPGLLKVFVDQYLVQDKTSLLTTILIGVAVSVVLKAVLTYLQQRYLNRLETKLSLRMSGGFLWHVLHLPMSFYSQRSVGDVAWRVSLNDQVSELLSGRLSTTVLSGITVVFFLGLMARYSLVLTAVSVGLALFNFVVLRQLLRRQGELNSRLLRERALVQGAAVGGLGMIETIKASGAESEFFSRWAGLSTRSLNAQQGIAVPTEVVGALPVMLAALTNAAVLGLGAYFVIQGSFSVGTLVAFQSLLMSFLAPVGEFVTLGSSIQLVQGGLKRLDDVLDHPTDKALVDDPAPDVGRPLALLEGRVSLRDLTFGYSPLAPPLIEGFDVDLEPGRRVAFVGGSGSGKSTLAKLVSGLYQPWSGEVLFDGTPRLSLPRRVIANSVGFVDQEISLFPGTVRDNISLWDETIDEFDVVEAAKDACIHDDIAARPGGYNSMVDEGGANFSGGQRQRLEIARALARRPSTLVLDEATSALDPLTERVIDQNLRRRGCACITIAHRLSTIRDADEIIVLSAGKVIERGTHESMKVAGGPYSKLIAT
jgi:NHLM bacteriocin system ABC transporter peptidase/ATP-binding protein